MGTSPSYGNESPNSTSSLSPSNHFEYENNNHISSPNHHISSPNHHISQTDSPSHPHSRPKYSYNNAPPLPGLHVTLAELAVSLAPIHLPLLDPPVSSYSSSPTPFHLKTEPEDYPNALISLKSSSHPPSIAQKEPNHKEENNYKKDENNNNKKGETNNNKKGGTNNNHSNHPTSPNISGKKHSLYPDRDITFVPYQR